MWKKGESGNPNGRPKGAKNNRTRIIGALEKLGGGDSARGAARIAIESADEQTAIDALRMLRNMHQRNKDKTV